MEDFWSVDWQCFAIRHAQTLMVSCLSDRHAGIRTLQALCSKHTRRREWVLSDNESDNGQEKDELTTPKKELSKQEKRNLRIKKSV